MDYDTVESVGMILFFKSFRFKKIVRIEREDFRKIEWSFKFCSERCETFKMDNERSGH